MKVVAVPGARSITGLRNGDTLVLRHSGASRRCELADNPTVGKLIVNHDRITVATILAGAAKSRPNRADRDGTKDRCAGHFVKNLKPFVDHLDVLRFADFTICIRWGAITADSRVGDAIPCERGGRNGWRVYHPLPKSILDDRIGSVLMLMRYFRVEVRLMFRLHRRPDQWLLPQRPWQIAVDRRDHGRLADLLCLWFFRCVFLGRSFRERAQAQQRDEDGSKAKN